MSTLVAPGVGMYPAFSGQKEGRNNPAAMGKPDIGPLPTGRYFIVDRESGGRLGWLRDLVLENVYGTDRGSWFALYRDDGRIDDVTMVNGVRRGAFRLHPIGPRGLSEGCITLNSPSDFLALSRKLRAGPMIAVAGGGKAYGTVDVA
jgi:hypothetical protein